MRGFEFQNRGKYCASSPCPVSPRGGGEGENGACVKWRPFARMRRLSLSLRRFCAGAGTAESNFCDRLWNDCNLLIQAGIKLFPPM